MASRREQAGLPMGAQMRALVLELLKEIATPVNRAQIGTAVSERLDLTAEQRAVREPGRVKGGPESPRSYVSWISEYTCNDLKHIGVCEQPGPGIYQLTEEGWAISLDEIERRNRERQRAYRQRRQQIEATAERVDDHGANEGDDDPPPDWRQQLLELLVALSPSAFEHLAAALLRVAGFDDVKVTGQSGDGGIDGIGVYRPSGLISFHTAFQCKRYQGSVGAGAVRDFRGSFVGRADRGIILTTGYFTRDARDEASRAGANPVDLIDGEALCELLREHKLGVRTTQRVVEDITVDDAYFAQFEGP